LFVSGSSTFEIKKKFKESLVGRTVNFELYPLSFEEFLIFKKNKYSLKKENLKKVNDELVLLAEEYIRFGGYPQIVLENSEEKKKTYLSQIISTYVKKDIRDLGNIRNISAFNKLLELLASQSGQILNVLELSNTLQTERNTILEYLDLLEQTFIIKRVTPFHQNLRSELSKNPKIFFIDTGLMHLLWLKDFPKVIFGNAFETFVFSELLRLHKPLHFWRTANKQEIDFILADNRIYAIEVKLNFQNQDNRHLKTFAENYPCRTIVLGLKGTKKGKYSWELVKELESEG
jgi:predicted AAA+ superfamily ATPase